MMARHFVGLAFLMACSGSFGMETEVLCYGDTCACLITVPNECEEMRQYCHGELYCEKNVCACPGHYSRPKPNPPLIPPPPPTSAAPAKPPLVVPQQGKMVP